MDYDVAKLNETPVSTVDDKAFMTDGWLPRLQFMTAKSTACQDNTSLINHWALVRGKTDITDMGSDVTVFLIGFRAKAMHFVGDGNIITNFNPESDVYKNIMALADTKDSGRMCGPEYLVWLPDSKQFATLFLGSKTARNEHRVYKGFLNSMATLKGKKIVTTKFTYFIGTVASSSVEISNDTMPLIEDFEREKAKFLNPPEQTNEQDVINEGTADGGRER